MLTYFFQEKYDEFFGKKYITKKSFRVRYQRLLTQEYGLLGLRTDGQNKNIKIGLLGLEVNEMSSNIKYGILGLETDRQYPSIKVGIHGLETDVSSSNSKTGLRKCSYNGCQNKKIFEKICSLMKQVQKSIPNFLKNS
ncbi:hypothetical protein POCGH01_00068800 [Plasmodium ovale]|uniref:Uncharacterized protein n=1 Tax=Plasmodium ovale TaxID=36330 RepID=A0A1D3JGW8_PLAOA|nr:hypothetical protein POCGH01_00068800 [Plasmodium ovale]